MQTRQLHGADRYRTIDEGRIVSFLVSPYAIAAGLREQDLPIARASLDRCLALGLPYRCGPDGTRRFDPAEVVNFIKLAHFSHGEPIWLQRGVAMLRRLMSEAVPGTPTDGPPDLIQLQAQRYSVTIRRRFNVRGRVAGERLRLRLPLPVEDALTHGLDIAFLPPPGIDVQLQIAPARLDALLSMPPDASEIEIGVTAGFTAHPRAEQSIATLPASEAELYTRASEGLIKVNSRIAEIAARLAHGCTNREQIVRRFWDYLFDELDLGFTHYDMLDPQAPLDWTLDHGRYNCQLGAALLAALCRAEGIPARMVSGYTLNPVLPTAHSWAEIWFDGRGWLPFDLYSMDLCGGERDNPWRWHYFGSLDHRMVAERPPLLFCGTGAIRLPAAWHMVSQTLPHGALTEFEELASGVPVYSESVSVARTG